MPVPTNAASQPAASMIWAWKALGVPSTASTRSSGARRARSRDAPRGAARSGTSRSRGDRRGREAAIEPERVVPEELLLLALRQVPRQHRVHRLRKPALAVGIVRRVHQDVLTEELDDGLRQLDAFGHLDRLEEAPGGDVVARPLHERRERPRDRLGVPRQAPWPGTGPPRAGP